MLAGYVVVFVLGFVLGCLVCVVAAAMDYMGDPSE
jgi:hypothetical protein